MKYTTVGLRYNIGKVAHILCVKNDPLGDVTIKGARFLLLVVTAGRLRLRRDGEEIVATAPCFVCFDERADITLLSRTKAVYWAVYFHPDFLNVNMTFDFIRAENYGDIASVHDMFLLSPFSHGALTVAMPPMLVGQVEGMCASMHEELTQQRDWYWSCRGRSYFMELMIALERVYHLFSKPVDAALLPKNPKLREAVLYIEGHYMEAVTPTDICRASGLNRTTLAKLMQQEIGMTATQYLYFYRVQVAKKQLEFTDVPIKDIAARVGFKTVQHFSRVFTQQVGEPPAQFRKAAVRKRKDEIT